jgi:hypothetical protein
MALTALEKIEAACHRKFPDQRPTKKALTKFMVEAGVAIGLAIELGRLILEGWKAYKEPRTEGVLRCPKCKGPAISVTRAGTLKCAKGHSWRPS